MIVQDFSKVAVAPLKADAPLPVDANAPLALAITAKLFEVIAPQGVLGRFAPSAWRMAKVTHVLSIVNSQKFRATSGATYDPGSRFCVNQNIASAENAWTAA